MISLISVIKTLDFRSLDRDPMAEMRSAPIDLSRYNALYLACAPDLIWWSAGAHDRRASIVRPRDPALCIAPRHMHLIKTSDLVPHGINFRKPSGL